MNAAKVLTIAIGLSLAAGAMVIGTRSASAATCVTECGDGAFPPIQVVQQVVADKAPEGTAPVEQMTLTFTKVEIHYKPQNSDGGPP